MNKDERAKRDVELSIIFDGIKTRTKRTIDEIENQYFDCFGNWKDQQILENVASKVYDAIKSV